MSPDAATTDNRERLEVHSANAEIWEQSLRHCGPSSLEHSWVYGDAVAASKNVTVDRFMITSGSRPVALVQGFRTHDFRLGSINRILRGPIWLTDSTMADRIEACGLVGSAFGHRATDLLFWLPELPDTIDNRRLMRALGKRRMVTGYSTVWLDIRPSESRLRKGLHGKWRNSLRAAEAAGVTVKAVRRDQAFDAAMATYDRFRRNRRFIGPPAAFIGGIRTAAAAAGDRAAVRVDEAVHDDQSIGGVAIIRHGASATYLAGWTSPEGRQRNAHNLLLWRAIVDLRKTGTAWLDLGGVDTQSAPGIARFKLGLGGQLCTLAGTFL